MLEDNLELMQLIVHLNFPIKCVALLEEYFPSNSSLSKTMRFIVANFEMFYLFSVVENVVL